jgi:hypothetical protein
VENVPVQLSFSTAIHLLEQTGINSGVLGLTWLGVQEKKIVAKFRDTASSLDFVRRFQGRELPGEWRLELDFEKVLPIAFSSLLLHTNHVKT